MRLTVVCLCWGLLAALARAEKCDPKTTAEGGPQRIRLQPAGPCEEGEEDTCLYQIVLPPLTLWLPREFGELGWMSGELRRLKEEVRQLRRCCEEGLQSEEQPWQEPPVVTTAEGGGGRGGREEKGGQTSADSMDTREGIHRVGVTQRTVGPLRPHEDKSKTHTDERTESVNKKLDSSQSTSEGVKGDRITRDPPHEDASVGNKTRLTEKKPLTEMTNTTVWHKSTEQAGPRVIKVSDLTSKQMDTDEITKSVHSSTDQSITPEELNPVTNVKRVSNASKDRKELQNISGVTGDVLTKTDTKPEVTLLNTHSVKDSGSERLPLSPITEHNGEIRSMDGDKSKVSVNVQETESNKEEEDLNLPIPMSLNDSSERKTPQELNVGTTNRSDTQSRMMDPLIPADIKDLDLKPHKQQVKTTTGMKTHTQLTTDVSKDSEKETRLNTHISDKVTNTSNQIRANVSSLKPSDGERRNPVTMDRGKNTKTKNPPPNNKQVGVGKSAKPVNKNKGKGSLIPAGKHANPPPSDRGVKEKNIKPKDLNLPKEKKVDLHSGHTSNASTATVPGSLLHESIDTSGGLKSTQAPINGNKNVGEEGGSLVNSRVNDTDIDDSEKRVTKTQNKTWTLNQKALVLGNMKSSGEEKDQVLDGNENITQLPDINTTSTQQMENNISGKQINPVDEGGEMSGGLHRDINSDTHDIKIIPEDMKQTPSGDKKNDSDILKRILKPLDQTFHNNSKQLVNNNTINLNQTNIAKPYTQDRPEDSTESQLKPHGSVGTGNRTRKVIPDVKLENEERQVDPDSPGNKKQVGITPTDVPIALSVPVSVAQPVPHTEDDEDNTKGASKPHHPQGRDGEEASSTTTMDSGGGEQPTSPSVDRGKNDSHPLIHGQPWKTKSKNTPGVNQLKGKGQKDSINHVEEGLKTAVDELSDHLSQRNIQSPAKNMTTPASVPDGSVVKTKDPGSVKDVKSESVKAQSHYRTENRTDEEIFTNKSNTSITHKANNTSGLKKLLPFHLNKNQTKERQLNIKKKESVVNNSKKKKQDPIPMGKVTKKGESHHLQGRKNNSQLMNLNPPEYGGAAKYTDEVRGSKSLTVEGIQDNHPIAPEPKGHTGTAKPAQDCSDYTTNEPRKTGVFIVRPDLRNSSFPVLCEMEAYGGGWTLLQRRYDGSVSFNRSWNEYKKGFGRLDGEFWLGNDLIHLLTKNKEMVLRIQLEDFEGLEAYATYEHFSVASELEHYRLTVGGYSGTAGDALRFSQKFNHDQKFFTTPDRDNDQYLSGNCGAYYSSGWWFDSCMSANLNGKYYHTWYKGVRNGIYWGAWPNISREYYPTNYRRAFKTVSMMIRPSSYKQ